VAARSVRVGNTDIPLTPTNLIIAANVLVFAITKGGVRALFALALALALPPPLALALALVP
jgi:hypothetical protein